MLQSVTITWTWLLTAESEQQKMLHLTPNGECQLPTVEGIGPSCLRLPDGPWKNILEYLEERFSNVKSETWISRMRKGEVVDENGIPLSAETPCRKGTFIFYYLDRWKEKPRFPSGKAFFIRMTI